MGKIYGPTFRPWFLNLPFVFSVCHSVSPSVRPYVPPSVGQTVGQTDRQSVSQPASQSVSHSISQSFSLLRSSSGMSHATLPRPPGFEQDYQSFNQLARRTDSHSSSVFACLLDVLLMRDHCVIIWTMWTPNQKPISLTSPRLCEYLLLLTLP